jgi:hypothetical protein
MQHMCITKCFLNGAVRCNQKFISSFNACRQAGLISQLRFALRNNLFNHIAQRKPIDTV